MNQKKRWLQSGGAVEIQRHYLMTRRSSHATVLLTISSISYFSQFKRQENRNRSSFDRQMAEMAKLTVIIDRPIMNFYICVIFF